MPSRIPWVERRFEEVVPAGLFPCLLERLRGTPARLEERLQGIPAERMRRRAGDRWSIQETVGHLIVVEEIWQGRLDDFARRLDTMRAVPPRDWPASLAPYAAGEILEVLSAFREARTRLIERLEGLTDEDLAHAATHPRLGRPMTIPDLMLFAAEHDDHHLATIAELLPNP